MLVQGLNLVVIPGMFERRRVAPTVFFGEDSDCAMLSIVVWFELNARNVINHHITEVFDLHVTRAAVWLV